METSKENTNEITCPYCDYEYSDSYEYIPNNSDGEIDWKEDCQECDKEFTIRFDCRNVDDGYTTQVLDCTNNKHDYRVNDSCYESESKDEDDISIYLRYEKCNKCEAYKFTPVKSDGSDFTKKELKDFHLKKRLAKKPKLHLPFLGEVKTGTFEFRSDLEICLSLKEPAGNMKIWTSLCRFFLSKGYKTQILPDHSRKYTVSFRNDWLECDISVVNYAITIKFYQNEILKDRKKGDGRYEHDQYNKNLTPSMQLKVRAHINMVKKWFVAAGFEFKPQLKGLDLLLERLKVKSLSEWTDPKPPMQRDLEDRDKKIIKSGDVKYWYDYREGLKRGVIYWNNGNQWFVLCNGELKQTSHFYLFDHTNEPVRKPLTKDEQIQRLHSELKHAENKHNYDKAKAIWRLIESYELYNIWSLKHGSWWGSNNSGYTDNKALAGVYTKENVIEKGYYNSDDKDSKAVLIK